MMSKRLGLVIGVLAIATVALAKTPPPAAPKPAAKTKVFVANLQLTGVGDDLAAVNAAVCNQTSRDARLDVACQDDVKALMAYDSLNAAMGTETACEGDDCVARLVKRTQAKLVVSGSIAKLAKDSYVLTLELVDSQNAKMVGRVEEQIAGDKEELFKRAQNAVKKLLAELK